MASRSLGTLTLDLIAKIGGFTAGMTEAERVADKKSREIAKKQRQRAKESEEAWSNVGSVIGAAFASIAVGAVFQKFIAETRQAENEQAQLAAVLKSTGESAGFGADKLNEMAESLAKNSTFGAGDINQAQTRLLSYTGIVGEQFPKALQAAIDMATRLGMDVPAAAEAVGKALDSPKDGLEALSKQGFRFTEDQKALVEELQRTGRTAEAQGIILTALESSYGGAAAAARDTFGGALAALQETINDLLTGDAGSMASMKNSVEGLNKTLASDETKQAFQTLIGWMTDLTNTAVRAATAITQVLSKGDIGGLMLSGKDYENPLRALEQTEQQIAKLKQMAGSLDPSKSLTNRVNQWVWGDFTDVSAQIKVMEQKAAALRRELGLTGDKAGGGRGAVNPPSIAPPVLDATGAAARAKAAKDAEREREAAAKRALADEQRAREAAANFIQGLNDQIAKTRELTTAEDLLRQVREGKVSLNRAELDRALGLATAIDMAKDAAEAEKRRNDIMAEGRQLALSLMDPMEQLRSQQEKFDELLGAGAITWEFYQRAIVKALNTYAEQVPGVKAAAEEIDEFTLQATRNIQDSLGSGLRSALEGDFASIGKSWRRTVTDMASQAISAQLNRALFGDFGKTVNGTTVTEVGGWIGQAIKAIGFADGGYTGAGGKFEPAGIVHAGEYVINADATKRIGVGMLDKLNGYASGGYVGSLPAAASGAMNGPGITFASQTVIHVDSRADRGAVQQDVLRIVAENNKSYTQQLQRIGVIPA